jgi:ribosome assembly protein 3
MAKPTQPIDAQISEAFSKYYMQKVTEEFAEDLDAIRNADDFHDNAVPLLVNALQQGTSIFSSEDKKRVVTSATADKEEIRKK